MSILMVLTRPKRLFFRRFSTTGPILLNVLRKISFFLNRDGFIDGAVEKRLKKNDFASYFRLFDAVKMLISQQRWN